MTGWSVLRRPLLLVGGLLAALALAAGVLAAVDSRHEHQRVARVHRWQAQAARLSLAENATLLKRLETGLPTYLVRTGPVPAARPWTLGAGAWTTDRAPGTVVGDVVRGLRRAGFTIVSTTAATVRASRAEGQVQVRVAAATPRAPTEVHAISVPALSPCC